MLSDKGFYSWCNQLSLREEAKNLIQRIRESDPARRVGSRGKNVSGFYPSRKMGHTVQFESHHVELAAIRAMEHDEEVLEFWDQPCQIKLEYEQGGRNRGVLHTPDFFVLRPDSAGWEEWKSEEQLMVLHEKSPNRYVRSADGTWRCPPGEAYAQTFGFYYRLRSSAEINPTFQRNIVFLEDYLHSKQPEVPDQSYSTVLSIVEAEPGITLSQLLLNAEPVTSDEIYTLIASDRIYVDWYVAPLTESQQVKVFRDHVTAKAYLFTTESHNTDHGFGFRAVSIEVGSVLSWDGRQWTLINPGESTVTLRSEGRLQELTYGEFGALVKAGKITGLAQDVSPTSDKEAASLLTAASEADLKEAVKRYEALRPILRGDSSSGQAVPERTLRDWAAKYRAAELRYGTGFVGLLPLTGKKGNRTRKLPDETIALIHEHLESNYETLKQKRRKSVYEAVRAECERKGIIAPSYKTVVSAFNRRPRYEQELNRKGKRAAYNHSTFYLELEHMTPRHGDRPFEVVHIDHTELDIESTCPRTAQNLGRPWVTFAVDAYSRRVLALYITYEKPSYRCCMMILRILVLRYGRLPQTVVVDGGKEFHSIYFDTLLARFSMTKKTRPSAKARYGSVLERLFGTQNTQVIYSLLGNTQITRNFRQVTKSNDPKRQAVWTLEELCKLLSKWAYETYDTTSHPALGRSPRDEFTARIEQTGHRSHQLIPYDEIFKILTLPSTQKGTAKVIAGRGVKINNSYYWHADFYQVEGSQVPVRYDPFDLSLAYAYVKLRWVKCQTWSRDGTLKNRTERELQIAVAEFRARNRNHSRNYLSSTSMAELIASAEETEALLMQRRQDAQNRAVLNLIEGAHPGDSGKVQQRPEESDQVQADSTEEQRPPNKPKAKRQTYEEYE